MPLRALIFDVDGTLAETEELHRAAFNASFQACGFDWHWDKALYGDLLQITGGKERIAAYMDRHRPEKSASAKLRIGELHARKTEHYTALVETGEVALRPGIERLLREAAAQRSLGPSPPRQVCRTLRLSSTLASAPRARRCLL